MGQFSTDEELHQAVNAYAFENAVNYSEALQAVTEIEQAKDYRNSDTVQRGIVSPSDAVFHAAAVAFQHKHKVPYTDAAKAVASLNKAQASNFSEALQRGHLRSEDAALHEEATAYSLAHAIPYDDAIKMVSRDAGPSFAEPPAGHVAVSDAALHAQACAYVRSEGMDYPAALAYAAKNNRRKTTAEGFIGPGADFSEENAAKKALEGQEIEIFKAGNHVDSSGRPREFPLALVAAMAAVYNPARHEAPLTLGHPEDNLPAYGWVKSLRATDDGRLMMRAGDLTPEFSEAVKAGRYKKRSASFYPPGAPNNPAPGNWYLRHVAWLGAQVPAVRGLADVNFEGAGDSDYPCFDF